ncbi:SigB/SigF/SigG family RNA polymerase sigma factor [Nocardiopsis suaedae]|uniref:SigB/SigF/SigG family RNA polymerase sigma factor n=1 Tax=Nocardiopsis suaedae TaxID=3018444 RepID=A0ABT4THN2_9ACTN|nr:SigB/SigF/SigG family RNA polymerase sigma factor [Nocardiopsis suaedae]MDA2803871.1 SigB/SigF/SigG family RNA polymerase sigma factor [Nocardiopsis suaedae]
MAAPSTNEVVSGAESDRRRGRDGTTAEELLRARAALPPRSAAAEELGETVVRMYAPVARREARRYRGRGESMDDLEQVAMLGLTRAVAYYDPDYGKPFLSYLLPTVTGELKRHFRDNTWDVRVPRKHQEKRGELNRFTGEFAQEHGRGPTTSEIATALDLDEHTTDDLLSASRAYSALSLDAPCGTGEEDAPSLGDTIGEGDGAAEGIEDHEAVREALARLPERERRIVQMRFYGNRTQTQIADAVGLSQMHVSRLLSTTLKELRADLAVAD